MLFPRSLIALLALPLALAAPIAERDPAPVSASSTQLSSYIEPARLAAAAYCPLTAGRVVGTQAKVLWATGDGRNVQRVYVAYSPSQGIVVAHQGTNVSSITSLLNDANIVRDDRDSRLSFLGADASITGGFQDAWLDTADAVLAQVRSALTKYPNSKILVTGHSLGASIALLDAAYIRKQTGATVNTILFGLPRTGNDAFAAGIDAILPTQRHITHYRDPVPHLPGETLGYQQPSGEVWLNDPASSGVNCGGQENDACSNSVHFYEYEGSDHNGPYYGGILMDCIN